MGRMVATTPKTRATKEGKIRGKAQRKEEGRCGYKALRLFAGFFAAFAIYQWSFYSGDLHAELPRNSEGEQARFADRLQQCLPTPAQETKETIRERQKQLNKQRNILNKVENKKKAIEKDQEKWLVWVQSMRQEIQQQKERHEETQQKLQKELDELLLEEKRLQEQEDMDLEAPEEEEDPVMALEQMVAEPGGTADTGEMKNKNKLNEALAQMQKKMESEYQQRLEQDRLRMQQTFEEMLAKAKNVEVINLEEMDAGVHANPQVRRVATAPFGVQRISKTQQVASHTEEQRRRKWKQGARRGKGHRTHRMGY